VGHGVAGLLDVRARAGSAAVAGTTKLTGRAHDVEAQARGGKQHDADGSGPQRRERERARLGRLAPTGWPHRVDGERGRARAGPKGRGRGGLGCFLFFFYSEFLIHFIFIFSIEFKYNQTTNSNLYISNMCINRKQSLSSTSCNNSCLP
jgi:hypothetical protein